MKSFFYFLIFSSLISCSAIEDSKNQENFVFAFGYLEKSRDLTDEVYRVFKKYLPPRYTENPLYLKSTDIDFNQKEVPWHAAIGGTVFALKELSEGIRFFPLMWEKNCENSVHLISKNEIPADLKKIKKILVFHTGYPSSLTLTLLYGLNRDKIEIFETKDENKAIEALVNEKVDIVLSEIYIYQNSEIRPALRPRSDKLKTAIFTELKVPCRTLAYSPKLTDAERKEILERLSSKPWEKDNYKFEALSEIKMEDFQKIQNIFNWDLDKKIRSQIRKL